MFLEGTYGRSRNELAGCALAQTGTGPNFCRAAIPMNPNSNRVNAGLGGAAAALPERQQAQSRLLRDRRAQRDEPGAAGVGQRRLHQAAGVRLGQPHHARAAEHPVPVLLQRERDAGPLAQPDQGHGAPHDEDRATSTPTATRPSRRPAPTRSGRSASRRTRSAPTRSTRRSASPTRRSARSARTARRRTTSKATSSTTTARPTSRTTGRSTTG